MTTSSTEKTEKPKPFQLIETHDLFDEKGLPKMETLMVHLYHEGRLAPKDVISIFHHATALFKKEKNVIHTMDPCTCVGDLHGQFYDLLRILQLAGHPSEHKYLFLGDYVDRGMFGIEILLLLCSFKLHYPSQILMLRGNHECRHISSYFNFALECEYKYNREVYHAACLLFDSLPLVCILNEKFFCVHAGISPDIMTVEEVNEINRFKEVPAVGPFCDLLWSDPTEEENFGLDLFEFNFQRNCSFMYSYDAVCQFLSHNNLLSVIRAHEVFDDGFKLYENGKETQFPTVISVFSAPNYCDSYGNLGAIITFVNNEMNIRQYKESEHPYYLPKFINVFKWSIPFLCEKVSDVFKLIIQKCDNQMEESIDAGVIRTKILTMGRMSKMFQTLREEQETITALKGLTGGIIPQGLLSQGPDAIRRALKSFQEIKAIDAINEQRPLVTSEEVREFKKKDSFKGEMKTKHTDHIESPKINIIQK